MKNHPTAIFNRRLWSGIFHKCISPFKLNLNFLFYFETIIVVAVAFRASITAFYTQKYTKRWLLFINIKVWYTVCSPNKTLLLKTIFVAYWMKWFSVQIYLKYTISKLKQAKYGGTTKRGKGSRVHLRHFHNFIFRVFTILRSLDGKDWARCEEIEIFWGIVTTRTISLAKWVGEERKEDEKNRG